MEQIRQVLGRKSGSAVQGRKSFVEDATSLDAFANLGIGGLLTLDEEKPHTIALTNYYARNMEGKWLYQQATLHLSTHMIAAYVKSVPYTMNAANVKAIQTLELYLSSGISFRVVLMTQRVQDFERVWDSFQNSVHEKIVHLERATQSLEKTIKDFKIAQLKH